MERFHQKLMEVMLRLNAYFLDFKIWINLHCKFLPHENYSAALQFLQPFSIDSEGFPCRDPAIPSPRSFHGVKICSVHQVLA